MQAVRRAQLLVKALKEEIGLPIHFHTHDTSGIAAASVLTAAEAGVDIADGAIASMSGLTSQPNLELDRRGAALHARATPALDLESLRMPVRLLGSGARSSTRRSRAA